MTLFFYIENLYKTLTPEQVVNIVLVRNGWETIIKPDDEIWDDDGVLIIERQSGNRVLVNMNHIALVCKINARRVL